MNMYTLLTGQGSHHSAKRICFKEQYRPRVALAVRREDSHKLEANQV